MARLIYSGGALTDLDPETDFLLESQQDAAVQTTSLIVEAVNILENHPLVCCSLEYDQIALVISRGQRGYVVLYNYEQAEDVVLLLAIRHQRETGYLIEST